jgi:hypothetical protein
MVTSELGAGGYGPPCATEAAGLAFSPMASHLLYSGPMATTKRLKIMQALYLERDRTNMLDKLAADLRLPKSILLREAVDDLLIKYKVLKPNKRLALLKAAL